MVTKKFEIEGMGCQSCVNKLNKGMEEFLKEKNVKFEVRLGGLDLSMENEQVKDDEVLKEIETLGFKGKLVEKKDCVIS